MRHAFIVSACKKYVPELAALLNSLEMIGNKHDVFVIGFELPTPLTDQFKDLSYKVVYYPIPEAEAREYGGESEILCRKRYWYSAEWGKDYDSVCILDADMLIIRPLDLFLEIAAKCEIVLGVSLEQKTTYGVDEDSHFHQRCLGEHMVKERVWNDKDMCCTPCFINAKAYESQLKLAWTIFTDGYPVNNFKAPDQQALNMILVAQKLTGRVILLPNVQWVGSNEKLLKPYTRFTIQQDGLIWTESGEPVFVVHGQFYKKKWRDCQLSNRHGCAEGYLGYSFNSDNMARGAMEGLYEWFKKCLNGKIKIDTQKAYVNDGHPNHTLAEIGEVPV